jgi:hypothetical protein
MYFVRDKKFEEISDAIEFCKSGYAEDVVTTEDGTVLMRHEQVSIDEIMDLVFVKNVLDKQIGVII